MSSNSNKNNSDYYELQSHDTDPKRLKKEREKARLLKKSQWWINQLSRGICHYCEKKFLPTELTLDHVVPLARGGSSTPGNCVPCCTLCNQNKKLQTPVDILFKELEQKKLEKKKSET